jgi:hypothetical protein
MTMNPQTYTNHYSGQIAFTAASVQNPTPSHVSQEVGQIRRVGISSPVGMRSGTSATSRLQASPPRQYG